MAVTFPSTQPPPPQSAYAYPAGATPASSGVAGFPPPAREEVLTYPVAVPASQITVVHGFGRDVGVHAYDPQGNEVEVAIQMLDKNTVQLSTDPELPFSGKVVVI